MALLSVTAAMAAAQNFRLGVNYSELIPSGSLGYVYSVVTATDSQGAIYLLVSGVTDAQANPATNYLIKLTPRGDQVVYQTLLNFVAVAMAVDPAGNAYLAGSGICATGQCANMVEKLGTDGKTVVYTTTIAPDATLNGIAADGEGRAYVTGGTSSGDLATTPGALQQTPTPAANGYQGFVARLKAGGAVDYATYFGGSSQVYPAAITVDTAGSAFVTGFASSATFPTTPGAYLAASGIPNFEGASYLMRLSPDGSSLIYSTFTDTHSFGSVSVAVDGSDNAVVAFRAGTTSSAFMRFNSQGTEATFSKVLPASAVEGLQVDGAGDTYIALSVHANFPVHNSLAPCAADGSSVLAVLDPKGDVLQATYIPGSQNTAVAVGLGAGSTVYVVGSPDATYTPTEQPAGLPGGLLFLTSLAQNPSAPAVELACVANAASYDRAGISGGEIVSLFGQGMGPGNGRQPQVDVKTGVPKQLAGVQVTFNDTPGPLLYVQDAQINAIAPWALAAGGTVKVCVVCNGAATNCLTRPVVSTHPGVFTVDGVYAAALNQDGRLNTASNPAQVGSTVSIFATGLGPISPAQPDGAIVGLPLPANVLQDGVYWLLDTFFIGLVAESTTVSYGGPAPFEVAGVSQVNFVVADTSQTYGGQSPYYLQAGGPVSVGALIVPGSNGFMVYVAGK